MPPQHWLQGWIRLDILQPEMPSLSRPFKAAAASLGVESIVAPVNDMTELQSYFTKQAREPNSGLVVFPDAFTQDHRAEIAGLAARYRIPTIHWGRSLCGGRFSA
jgi:putative ABC transport system substrate-binding protein